MSEIISPIEGGTFKVTSTFGERSLDGKTEFHGALDIVGLSSDRITAVCGGTVARSRIVTDKSDRTWEWGNYVAVQAEDGRIFYYCHMNERYAKVGDAVGVGTVLGIEGSTGYSTGKHLHLEVRAASGEQLDPAEIIGIANAVGIYSALPDYAALVSARCGFETQTVDYLNAYQYAYDLWRKLWEQMRS